MTWLHTLERWVPTGSMRARLAAVPCAALLLLLVAAATLSGPWWYTWRVWGFVLVALLVGAATAWALAPRRRATRSPAEIPPPPGAVRLELVRTLVDLLDQAPTESIRYRVQRALADAGVTAFEADGQLFDPSRHEAVDVDVEWTDDPRRERRVARTLRSGYAVGAEVVRVADVLVYRT